jgi:hypothetical protein
MREVGERRWQTATVDDLGRDSLSTEPSSRTEGSGHSERHFTRRNQ